MAVADTNADSGKPLGWKFLEEYEHVREAFDTTHDEQYAPAEGEDNKEDQVLSNRQKRQKPKGGLYWCSGCDSELTGDWRKCKGCGHRNGVKRFKK